MAARREIEVEATPAEVWEAIATEEGRADWLGEPEREIYVESADAPHRLVWWWCENEQEPTRVELLVVAAPLGSRVVVIESTPQVPLARLAASLTLVPA